MNINDLCLPPDAGLMQAVRAMDGAHYGLVLVVDAEGVLIGVLADSDIRRALLSGSELDRPLEQVMTRDFLSVPEAAEDQDVVQLLQSPVFARRNPALVPVVDAAGRPVGLETGEALRSRSELDAAPAADHGARRVLVIGGAGFVGSVLVRQLLEQDLRVCVLDKLLYGREPIADLFDHPRFEFVEGDTRHIDELVPVVRRASAVVHLAELVGDPLCAHDPATTFEINYLATATIARICAHLQINRFVYVSSCSVYGASENPDAVLDESSPLAPVSLYARTKINSERVILGMADGNFSPCILRLGTVFGLSPRPRFDLVVNTLTAHAVTRKRVEIFGGNQWRPHVHVSDVAGTIGAVLRAPLPAVGRQVFNVIGENCRIADLGQRVASVVPGTEVVMKGEVSDPRNYRVSGERARGVLGYRPAVTLDQGIRELADALRDGRLGDPDSKGYHNVNLFAPEDYGE